MDLIESIRKQAEDECRELREHSEKRRNEKKEETRRKCLILERDRKRERKKKEETLREKKRKMLEIESKKYRLQKEKEIFEEVLNSLRKDTASEQHKEDYSVIVSDWICEAAAGLGAPEAVVFGGEAEVKRMDKEFLRNTEGKIRERGGLSVSLTLSADPPLREQGILLKTADGRMMYDNTVKTRLRRHEEMIGFHIQKEVFGAGARQERPEAPINEDPDSPLEGRKG